ncbi:MAG: hypothetical protein Q4C47_05455 [Planctomycetia bacterium]|nr:hypothetical protein [Planctomycetia bacterium]
MDRWIVPSFRRNPANLTHRIAPEPPQSPPFRTILVTLAILMISINLICTTGSAADEQLRLIVKDRETGDPLYARIQIWNANGKPRPIRGERLAWADHLTIPGSTVLKLPVGEYAFVLWRGAEYRTTSGTITMGLGGNDTQIVEMERAVDAAASGWYSGDLDVRRAVRDLPTLLEAEDLYVIAATTFSNEKPAVAPGKLESGQTLAPDGTISYRGTRFADPGCGRLVRPGAELLIARCGSESPSLPGAMNLWPTYEKVFERLRKGREPRPWIDLASPAIADLPLLVALGSADSVRLMDARYTATKLVDQEKYCRKRDKRLYPDPYGLARWNLEIYVKLLEAGVFLPPTAGSGSGAANSSTGIGSNAPGENRVYVAVDGVFSTDAWWAALRQGRSVVTNGPLMIPSVYGKAPGYVFETGGSAQSFPIGLTLSLRNRDRVNYLEILKNGVVYREIPFMEYAQSGQLPEVEFEEDEEGWFLIRAVLEGATDRYRFAMTAPWFVRKGGRSASERPENPDPRIPPTERISRSAAQFFLDWTVERAREVAKHPDEAQRKTMIEEYRIARDFWRSRVDAATCE